MTKVTKRINKRKIKTKYTRKQYNSKDGMMTTIWGPGLWHALHTISFNYPINPTSKDKKHYRDFILQLKYVLPCGKCRENLLKNFKKLPLTYKKMESRATFSKYIYDLHELINKMLHKTSNLSYDEVRDRYEDFRARCKSEKEIKINSKILKENGCVEPLKGKKSKCVLKIVPENDKCDTFQINVN